MAPIRRSRERTVNTRLTAKTSGAAGSGSRADPAGPVVGELIEEGDFEWSKYRRRSPTDPSLGVHARYRFDRVGPKLHRAFSTRMPSGR